MGAEKLCFHLVKYTTIQKAGRQAVSQDNKTQPFSPENQLQTVIFFR